MEDGARDRKSERGVQGGQPRVVELLSQSYEIVRHQFDHLSSCQSLPFLQSVLHQFIGGSLAGKDCIPHSSTMSVDGFVGLVLPTRPGTSPSTFVRLRLRVPAAAA